ncbi:GPW/gp25 family protein [Pasteurella multocida]|uniref:GPW/gp25 family protein n=1 Tax=Pasteurella multocida TaxID=747 RepID=UPI0029B694FE|nr:GPW/gp25 family protein [Pasteurella multocida]MDY0471114.1 GPW/gp25 family protein [Pasteurella multocida]MDY0478835.1 GPW/gp25 family protein [Pasteurella multocida]MDY0494801.1 GPW/gp25 family protein [Pasteurella multocida]MDY0522901.1 GPW/gp25 family protein [Pasteurella multocida]
MNTITLQHTHWQIAPTGMETVQGEDDLHQCIKNILSTRKGSDVLRPEFGSDHFEYIDQPFDVAVPNMVREIFIAIATWEKRVIVQKVHIEGTAPHFTYRILWAVAEDVARQIYTTEFSHGT